MYSFIYLFTVCFFLFAISLYKKINPYEFKRLKKNQIFLLYILILIPIVNTVLFLTGFLIAINEMNKS